VVGEDLGTVEPSVTKALHERGMLSSAVLWFQRDWDSPGQPFVDPARWDPRTMASISTHDLPTVSGSLVGDHVRVRAELGLLNGPAGREHEAAAEERGALLDLARKAGLANSDAVLALHALLATAASRLVLAAPSDVVGETRQPNLPGTTDQYPNWRIPLPVSLEAFFADERVRAATALLRSQRG
jgi:4-alpha-glucanotransferase